jgi:hypothetical protein
MSQQSEIFARYRSLFNSGSVRPLESETTRKLNNMDFVDFLFELVKSTKGQKQFKNIILKGSLSKLKKTNELNKTIKNALISQFGCDNTLIIPTKYTTKSSLGIEMDKSELDAFGLFGIDPEGSPGRFLYEGNDPTKHVNFLLYKAQGVNSRNPLSINYEGKILFTIYAKTPNTFIFKFGEYYENKKFNIWLDDYLNLIDPIFNTVNFTAILTDIITGAISLRANKNKIEIRKQSSLIKGLQKIFGFCSEVNDDSGSPNDSANNILRDQSQQNSAFNGEGILGSQSGLGDFDGTGDTLGQSGDPFDFDFNDLDEIERDVDLRSRGVIRFSTCGDLELDINPDDILSGLELLFQNANQNDVYSYDGTEDNQLPVSGNDQEDVLFDNSEITPNSDKAADFFDEALRKGANNVINQGETDVIIDLPTMNAELQLNILKAIPYALMQMILSPKITAVPKLFAVLNGDDEKKSVNDFIKNMTPTISKVGASVTGLLIQNIFDAIKSDLTRLARQLAIAYLKQRGSDYLLTLRSLINLLGLFSRRSSGCGGVLNKLLGLLKLSNFGPMPRLPGPLILVGGVLKPGMNSVGMINDIKSNLTEKGIETAPTLPDGTPNNMMIAIEETVKVMTSHIKTNSTIQTFGISAVGPVTGYGQIQ